MNLLTIFDVKDFRLLPERLMDILFGDQDERNRIYKELLSLFHGDLSYDWFRQMYEEEYSQRKEKKQDFTPNEVCQLVSEIVNTSGTVHEPTAGTGGMVVAAWHHSCEKYLPWNYRPSKHIVNCWELSDRAVPFLLFNLSIRGMMGYVTHGNVLTLEVTQRYAILNRHDDPLAFSDVVKIGANDRIVPIAFQHPVS